MLFPDPQARGKEESVRVPRVRPRWPLGVDVAPASPPAAAVPPIRPPPPQPTTYTHTPDPRLGPRTLNYLPHTHTRPTHVSVPVLSISYRYRAGLQPLVQQTPLRRGLRRRLGRQLAGRERPSRRRALRSPRRLLAHPGIRPARAAQVRGRRRSAEQRQRVCGRQGVRM